MPAHCDKGMKNDKIHGLSSTVKRKLEVTQYSFELNHAQEYALFFLTAILTSFQVKKD